MSTIKLLRMIKGYTQQHVAKAIGCTVGTYNRKENSKDKFTIDEYMILADMFNISVEKLLATNVEDKILQALNM